MGRSVKNHKVNTSRCGILYLYVIYNQGCAQKIGLEIDKWIKYMNYY